MFIDGAQILKDRSTRWIFNKWNIRWKCPTKTDQLSSKGVWPRKYVSRTKKAYLSDQNVKLSDQLISGLFRVMFLSDPFHQFLEGFVVNVNRVAPLPIDVAQNDLNPLEEIQ